MPFRRARKPFTRRRDRSDRRARLQALVFGILITGVMLAAAMIGLSACDPMTPPTRAELESDARKLFESKLVIKDPGSNLCLVVLNGDFGKRPIYETYLIRCKSEKHLLDPVAE